MLSLRRYLARGSAVWSKRRTTSTNGLSYYPLACHEYAVPIRNDFRLMSSTASNQQKEGKKTNTSGYLFFGSLVVLTGYLGIWQTKRYFRKVNVVEGRKSILKKEARPIDTIRHDKELCQALEDRDSVLKTKVDHGKVRIDLAMKVGPRPPPQSADTRQGGGLGSSAKQQGYFIVVPVEFEDSFLLINCGWIEDPNGKKDASTFLPFSFSEDTRMSGILHHGEKPGHFLPSNEPETGVWRWFDAGTMKGYISHKLNKQYSFPADILCEALPQESDTHFRRKPLEEYEKFYVDPATHVSYAVTWYSLCVLGFFMTARLLRQGR